MLKKEDRDGVEVLCVCLGRKAKKVHYAMNVAAAIFFVASALILVLRHVIPRVYAAATVGEAVTMVCAGFLILAAMTGMAYLSLRDLRNIHTAFHVTEAEIRKVVPNGLTTSRNWRDLASITRGRSTWLIFRDAAPLRLGYTRGSHVSYAEVVAMLSLAGIAPEKMGLSRIAWMLDLPRWR